MCVEIFDEDKADKLAERLEQCDCIRFSDGYWYKFTQKNVTKENAIEEVKNRADLLIGSNDEDGIAFFLDKKTWQWYDRVAKKTWQAISEVFHE